MRPERFFLLLALMLTTISAKALAEGEDTETVQRLLGAPVLTGSSDIPGPVKTRAFDPPRAPTPPAHELTGRIVIAGPGPFSHARSLTDDFSRLQDASLKVRELPPLDARVVQDGNDIVPARRTPHAVDHPYWEWILSPGMSWDEPGDGDWSRAVVPFSLQQRNQNCTHYGLMTFLYRGNGTASRAYYQVTSETCIWLKADLWGTLDIRFIPGMDSGDAAVVQCFRDERGARLPVSPISKLVTRHPRVSAGNFEPEQAQDATLWGLVDGNSHYIGGCQTRYGPHPFCESLILPSYSIAKSVFTGLGFLQLKKRYPGSEHLEVTDWVPECRLDDDRWNGVKLEHLVDMRTGLYGSAAHMEDEGRITHTPFIQGETHRDKVSFACRNYPRRDPPGTRWVYHTSESYLAGLIMSRFLEKQAGKDEDLFEKLFIESIADRLDLSPASRYTRRTYDSEAQPFAGYGLNFHADDLARLARWLNGEARNTEDLFEPTEYAAAVSHSDRSPGPVLSKHGLDYRLGFWAADASSWVGCAEETWIPFLSGFGGITVALLPNGMVYYYVSDSGIFRWAKPVIEAHKIRPICEA